MDFATLNTILQVENKGLSLDVQSFQDVDLRDFLTEYFPTGRLLVRNITQDDRNPTAEKITISGTGGSKPFADLPVTIIFSLLYDAKLQTKVVAILMEGTCDEAWMWHKSFPSLEHSWLSIIRAIPVAGHPPARLILCSYNEEETAKRGFHFTGAFAPGFLGSLHAFLPGDKQQVAGSIEMVPANRSLNTYQLDKLPAVILSGPEIDLTQFDETAFPLPFSRLTYSLYCRPYLDLAQLCWAYKSFLIVEGTIQFTVRGKSHFIPLSATFYEKSSTLLITASPADGIEGVLEEIGGLVGGSLFAPNGIVGAADVLQLTEITVLVDTGGQNKIGYITCHVETGENIRWTLIPGLLTLDAIDLHFRIDRPFGSDPHVGIIASGLLAITEDAALELSAYFDHDNSGNDVSFGGTLKRGPLRARDVFKRFVGYDNPHLPDVQVDNFNFLVNPGTKSYSAEIALSDQWKLKGPSGFPVHLDYLHFRFLSQGEANTEIEMRAVFDVCGCMLYVAAEYEGVAKGWTFRGGTSKGNPIPVGIGIDTFVQAMGNFGPVPAMLKELTLNDLDVVFNTLTSDFSFRATVAFPIDGNSTKTEKASLTVHLDFTREPGGTSKHALNVGGVLHLLNREFAVGYGSHGDTSLLVATYDSPKGDKINVLELLNQISRKFKRQGENQEKDKIEIPGELSVSLKHAQLAFGKTGNTSKFLFGIELDAGIELSQLPLVGSAFDRSQTLSVALQLLVLTDTFSKEEVQEINRLTAACATKLPEETIEKAQGQVQIKASVRLGEISQQLHLPLKTNVGQPNQPSNMTSPDIVPTAPAKDRMVKWVNIQKAFGPVHFQRVGIGLAGQNIDFLLDASLEIAGLTITLEGLAAECALTDLSQGKFRPSFHLDGLGIDFKRGELEIGGALLRLGEDQYDGALTIRYKQLGIQALGSYRRVNDQPSLFVYALINYPIGGPPFFYVEGLALGFGYNRRLKVPTIDTVSAFPLVKQALSPPQTPDTPMNVAKDLSQHIQLAEGEYFFTAAVRFSSFKNIQGFALLAVLFGQHFEIDVLGKAMLVTPPGEVKPLVSASLALLARFSPDEGILMVMAKLLPDAYVFSPNCHLTGGFAFCCWFGTDHKGDFVLTLGGYHKSFNAPAHYPQVPRLGLNWQVDTNLRVSADAYFALTPAALMVGGHLEAVWQSGNLRAWFTAGVDFLMGWQPFHYDGRVYVSLGASYSFQFFGWHTVSIELTADLQIWGPPFSGIAHVHWFIISFDVTFGEPRKPAPLPLTWEEFQKSFLPGTSDIFTVAVQAGKVAQHGSLAKSEKNANQRAHLGVLNPREFSIVVNSAIPITTTQGTLLIQAEETLKNFTPPVLGIAPMGKKQGQWTSELKVTIQHSIVGDVTSKFRAIVLRQAVPVALWGEEIDPKKRKTQLLEHAICGYEIRPARPVETTSLHPLTASEAAPSLLSLSAFPGSKRLEVVAEKEKDKIRGRIKDSVHKPEVRLKRQGILQGLLFNTEIDWTGMTVESWRGTPTLVEFK